MTIRISAYLVVFCLAQTGVAMAQMSPAAQRGMVFSRANCSTCHAVEQVGDSPLRIAPPFRELQKRYPGDSLRRSLMEGIQTGHQNMPQFQLDPGQADDVIAYLKSLTP